MHQRKSKKLLIYFFLLILFGSINNINLIDTNFYKIKDIKISGLEINENKDILKKIQYLKLNNIFFINRKNLNEIIENNTLVERFQIFKKYPSSLNIVIERTQFLANINLDGQIFFVGSNGKLSKQNAYDEKLPFIFGKPNIKEFLNFKKQIDQSKISYSQIKNMFFFPSKRWDIELKNGTIIKLPKSNIKKSLNRSFEVLNDEKLKNIKIIDVRIKNQIILNE